ncbi:MAG: branched-chain amino acid ABC transporter permease [Devosia sp.]
MPRAVVGGLLAVLALGLVAVPMFGNAFWVGLVMQIMIFGLLAISVDLMIRHVGLFPLCNGAFFAVAAYAVAMLEVQEGWPTALAVPAALAAAGLTGIIFGISVRTGGVYFILITLAFGQMVLSAATSWTAFTGGDNGITNVPYPSIAGFGPERLSQMYALVLIVVAAATALYARLVTSLFGLTLNGIRDSESRMIALGYRTVLRKYVAFVVSSLIAGLAGVLYAYANQFVSPAAASLVVSVEAGLMAILGGSGTLIGPFIGAAVIMGIRNVVSAVVPGWPILMGLVFIAVVLFLPRGLVSLGTMRGRRRGAAEPRTPSQ